MNTAIEDPDVNLRIRNQLRRLPFGDRIFSQAAEGTVDTPQPPLQPQPTGHLPRDCLMQPGRVGRRHDDRRNAAAPA